MSSTSELDRLIACSKQITEDLLALRREAKSISPLPSIERRSYRVTDRLSLVIDNTHLLATDLYALWESAIDARAAKRERAESTARALENGQLKLISGSDR
jgi:hypothetical protein